MKKLNLFTKVEFDFRSFAQQKRFEIVSVRFNEAKSCCSLSVVITKDDMNYGEGFEEVTNAYERFFVYLTSHTNRDDVTKYHVGQEIRFIRVDKCVAWSSIKDPKYHYLNELSVYGEVKIVE